MDLPEETLKDLTTRLNRAEGQIRGVTDMINEGRDCRDVVTQLSAAKRALDRAGLVLIASGLRWCLENPESSAAEGLDPDEVQKIFAKLA